MRKKEERFVVTFATTTGAMAMERACQDGGAAGAADSGAPEHHRRLRDVLVCAAVGPGGFWRPW